MIRNIVFDMGMVLMDFHPLTACRAIAPDEAGAQALMNALFKRPEWAQTDEGNITLEALGELAMESLTDRALRPLIPALLAGMPSNVLSPIPGMDAVVDALLLRGFRLYLLSNAGQRFSQHRGVIPRIEKFSGVVFSADEGLVKPDPALYQRLTERYGLLPEECVFIDDLPRNVQTAVELGWQGYPFDGDIPALVAFLDTLPNPNE